jgi:hypothetical protein
MMRGPSGLRGPCPSAASLSVRLQEVNKDTFLIPFFTNP